MNANANSSFCVRTQNEKKIVGTSFGGTQGDYAIERRSATILVEKLRNQRRMMNHRPEWVFWHFCSRINMCSHTK